MKKLLKMPFRRMPRRIAATALRAKATTHAGSYEKEDYEIEEEPNMKFSHALMVVLGLHIIAVGGVFAFNSIKAGQAATAKGTKESTDRPPLEAAAQPKPSPPQGSIEGWEGRTHTVQAGDTLSRLASLHKTSIEAIEKENDITSYSMIRVGQILKIPTGKPEIAKPATDPASAAAKHAFLTAKTDLSKPPAAPPKTESPKPNPTIPSTKASNTHPSKKEETPPAADGNTYVVSKGDNPYSIAKKLHVSYNELLAINEIRDPTRVRIGQKLKIPPRKN
ncbi:MAG TPA: LysM peptidoglycan-binding domain-containing protein [Terrimicrobiaceae bacterium]